MTYLDFEPHDHRPLGLIPCINLDDGSYMVQWIGNSVKLDSREWGILEHNASGVPLWVKLNVWKGHGFLWIETS